ncbi:MAG: class I SAM-dependent methyltransferase [Deltaproteobacteria bacterium]|nr:class I SAM-dependent methyltransferase [Deltaproteobacteria bacterium]
MLDAPCGDFFWMREVAGLPASYVGGDIVPALIEGNRSKYADPGRRFEVLDIVRDPIPRVDLIHCRDCLVHLPLAMAKQAIANFQQSGATYLLTTTFPKTGRANIDISIGEWRPLDLELAPFGFPPPLWSLAEVPELSADGITHFKHLALWKLADLPAVGPA